MSLALDNAAYTPLMRWRKAKVLFSPLPQPRSRWRAFATSFGLQSTALVLGVLAASVPVVQQQLAYVKLIAAPHEPVVWQQPATETPMVAPEPKPKPLIQRIRHRQAAPVLPAPVAVPSLEVATKSFVQPAPEPREVIATQEEPPKLQWHVQSVNFGSSATPSLPKMAPRKVQTGGFGDPYGVAVQRKSGKVATIAAIGGFDLPAGPGYGNGNGGARGLRGVIPSAGFGNGIASNARPRPLGHGVQTTNFAGPVMEAKKLPLPPKPTIVPVTIREKPSPAYTREARELRVEGEVLLEVVFASNGRVQVKRVLRGLGYGLDEAAVQAAERIRFSPAQQGGQAVDISATVHIVFQLS
ncbi:MAG: TonB family protein [Candidatus Korobacteraceae bacterium]